MDSYRADPAPSPDLPFTKPKRKPWRWNPDELTILNVCMVVTALMALFGLFLFALIVAAGIHDRAFPQPRSTTYHITVPPGSCLYYTATNTYTIAPCAP